MSLDTIFIVVLCILFAFIGYNIGKLIERFRINKIWEEKIKTIREQAAEKSRQVVGGKFAENLSPYFPDFKYDPTEIRFIGSPVDFVVFKGLSKKDPEEVIFLEIKSGSAQLNIVQKKLKNIIKEKRVSWEEYRVPEEVTKNK